MRYGNKTFILIAGYRTLVGPSLPSDFTVKRSFFQNTATQMFLA
ncbi:hypothetical protein GRAN_2276 [Granulicella sibirica]|uniref:Uncharacterized protein n=1 Tax=Granulicella sibirica TaxID=2479048 RepID=A0A4Q0TB09_9BACT|nr:hypothetical protein GRAN_2276 [Granulicella sibirica]